MSRQRADAADARVRSGSAALGRRQRL